MAAKFITVETITVKGDNLALDTIMARRFRGYLPGYIERVLDLNRGLAELGPLIPPGTTIVLPPPLREESTAEIEVVRLWE